MNKSNVFKFPVVNVFYMLLIIIEVNISYSQTGWQVQTIGKQLNSVYFLNASTGFAAGSNGVIYKTTNSAAMWECYDTKSSIILNAVYFPSVSTGFAAGNAGYIYRTINSGTNWIQVPSGTTNSLISIYFIDDNTGWAVGASGRILKSTNGGTSWLTQISGTTNQLNSVFFTSALNGICAGLNIVLRTTDGGANWVTNNSAGGNSVIMVNASTGFIANNFLGDLMYKTTNGGINWTTFSTNTGLACYGLSFTTSNDIWASTIEGSIIRTTNAGNNWIVQYNSSSNVLYSINNKSNFGCSVGDNGTIITTTNSGSNWSISTRGTEVISLTDIHFVNQQTGFVIGWNGIIYSTTTGGRIWTKQISNTTTNLNSVYFTSAQTGFVAGNSGILAFTNNGGSSWTSTGISVENLNSIYFINATTGLVCGNNGALLRTTNAGATWNTIPTGIIYSLTDISFPSSSTGYIVSSYLPLLKTTNSGQNWTQLSIPIAGGYSISFVNDNTGYIKGSNLIRTTNGGLNWVNLTGSQGAYTSFRNAALGWIVGSTGADSMLITGTNDGGTSWNTYTSKITNMVGGIFMLSDSTGWCVGNDGIIFKTSNGGGILTSINDPVNSIPENYKMLQNYPNPFNPVTSISFDIPIPARVKIIIYDLNGKMVEELVNEDKAAGSYRYQWDGTKYSSGVYFYKIEAGDFKETKKMILIK
ncbi:MAG: YCF48-related protein [Ignavibacteria bacterium]